MITALRSNGTENPEHAEGTLKPDQVVRLP
jgi:hypothetical protein